MNQSLPSSTPAGIAASAAPVAAPIKVAVVASGWHKPIVGQAVAAIAARFAQGAGTLECFEVPGAFEIPLHAKRLAQSGRFDAIIACGLVVDGGIYRHEFVAAAVIDGLMQVQLATDVPVFSAVLTPHHFHEHGEHLEFFAAHFVRKGTEVAEACIATVAALRQLPVEA